MENNQGSYESLKKQRPDITRSEYCRLRQQIRREIDETPGLRAMARSQRRREAIIDGVKQEIIKQNVNPKYRDNEGLRYLERQLDFGEKKQRGFREYRDIKSFLEERMRQ